MKKFKARGFKFTEHALKRAKERLGIKGKSLVRFAEKAWYNGLDLHTATGDLQRRLISETKQHGNAYIKVYGHNMYVFKYGTVITILDLPQNLHRYWDKRGELIES